MKKLILALAVAFACSSALPVMAQTEKAGSKTEQSQKKSKKDGKKSKKDGKQSKKGNKKCKKGAPGFDCSQCNLDSCPQFGPGCENGPKGCPALKGIELTDAQKAQVKSIKDEERQEVDKIFEQVQAQKEKLDKKYEERLEKVLTPEQMVQYRQNMENVKANAKKSLDGKRPCAKGKAKFKDCKGAKGPRGNDFDRPRDGRGPKGCPNPAECPNAKVAKTDSVPAL